MNPSAPTLHGPRITLRPWSDDDLAPFAAMNADAEVMHWFPAPLSREDSDAMVGRARALMAEQGWGHWALEVPGLGFAGFVGLSRTPFDLRPFGPPLADFGEAPVEIGWRLARPAWGHGYATEAARVLVALARDTMRLPTLVSFTALGNVRSQAVMLRLGLSRIAEFDHPRLAGHALQRHVLHAVRWPAG